MSILTIFYDGHCPLCTREIEALSKRDCTNSIVFEDLHQRDFESKHPLIKKDEAFLVIHGLFDGALIKGIDVNYHAWRIVGKGAWVAPLKWRLTRPLAKLGYRFFAHYRHQLSGLYSKISGRHCDCTANRSQSRSEEYSKE